LSHFSVKLTKAGEDASFCYLRPPKSPLIASHSLGSAAWLAQEHNLYVRLGGTSSSLSFGFACKDTKLSANNLLSPRKINKSLRKRAGKVFTQRPLFETAPFGGRFAQNL
jgi:hypothetical protein